MSEHKATVRWSRDGKDFTYKTYSRDHVWVANGNEIPASATVAYLGNPQRVDPEAALVAALSSCHMLTFLYLAAKQGYGEDWSAFGQRNVGAAYAFFQGLLGYWRALKPDDRPGRLRVLRRIRRRRHLGAKLQRERRRDKQQRERERTGNSGEHRPLL